MARVMSVAESLKKIQESPNLRTLVSSLPPSSPCRLEYGVLDSRFHFLEKLRQMKYHDRDAQLDLLVQIFRELLHDMVPEHKDTFVMQFVDYPDAEAAARLALRMLPERMNGEKELSESPDSGPDSGDGVGQF